MIDRTVFVDEMRVLEERFGKELSEEATRRYYDYLAERMDTDGFRQAARAVWATNRFFPRPADFLAVEAASQWQKLVGVVAEFEPPHHADDWTEPLDARTCLAVRNMGGILAVKDAMNRRPIRTREQFTEAYEAVILTDAKRIRAHDRKSLPPTGTDG